MSEYVPGLEKVVAVETEISFLDVVNEKIVVRGYDLIDLAKKKIYMDIIPLLLTGQLPNTEERVKLEQEITKQSALPDSLIQIVKQLPKTIHPMDALRTGISALAGYDDSLDDQSTEKNIHRAFILLGQIPMLISLIHHRNIIELPSDLTYAGRFLYAMVGSRPTPLAERIFDQTLILYSEHELPNSTFSARVIASTLTDLYGALTGAVASLKGPLHGGANEAVMQMLQAVQNKEELKELIIAKLMRRERVMGFGHRVYMRKADPRAVLLKQSLAELSKEKKRKDLYDLCIYGEQIMKQEKNLYPNLDYYAAPIFHLLGLPTPLFTPIFFASRTAGLCAHVIEQQQKNRLFRPRVRYIGSTLID
ncbi:citrate synthase [Seinonella peptonophila]|uniref:Citrate synthase n=1 Tax=Seinonella peptonophila TaxID=112248 RepID=A0A1M4TE21_9BACL|nr:citrate synthase [Seinonella peptonophila]SHE42625.1 citrate synthase [Seinonella peptonophila]